MRARHATSELDRISGLASLARPKRLPIYDSTQSNEEAWAILLAEISLSDRADIIFCYPEAGDAGCSWAPSWLQIEAGAVHLASATTGRRGLATKSRIRKISGTTTMVYPRIDQSHSGIHKCDGLHFLVAKECRVYGLDGEGGGWDPQTGREGFIEIGNDPWQSVRVVAHHGALIDSTKRYTLVISALHKRLMVGLSEDGRRIQKVCVLDFQFHNSKFIPKERARKFESLVLI